MKLPFGVAISETTVDVKIGRLIIWYCVDPHALGVRWWNPQRPRDRQWTRWFDGSKS